jgi:hypothetical protein
MRRAGHLVACTAAHAITSFLGLPDPEHYLADGQRPELGLMLTTMTHPSQGVVVDHGRTGYALAEV